MHKHFLGIWLKNVANIKPIFEAWHKRAGLLCLCTHMASDNVPHTLPEADLVWKTNQIERNTFSLPSKTVTHYFKQKQNSCQQVDPYFECTEWRL